MTVLRHEVPLGITLVAPFVSGGLQAGRMGVDVTLSRNADERLILPGTLVAGVLRAAMEAVRMAAPNGALTLSGQSVVVAEAITDLFGTGSAENDDRRTSPTMEGWRVANNPARGTLVIRDLEISDADEPKADTTGQMVRVEIDRDFGAVREGHIVVIECPFPAGRPVTFSGIADYVGGLDPSVVVDLLTAALSRVPAIGAMKSVGYGRVRSFLVGAAKPVAAAVVKAPDTDVTVTYSIDRPFQVDQTRRGSNLYIGSPVVPGGAIKGSLACSLKQAAVADRSALDAFLASLTIGHAHPTDGETGAEVAPVLPFSLAVSGETVVDVLLSDPDALIRHAGDKSIRFAGDWKAKDRLTVATALDLHNPSKQPRRDVRTRTAIDPDTGGARFDIDANAGMLYSDSAVCANEHEWVGRWALPPGGNSALFDLALGILAAGIAGLGKTNAIIHSKTVVPTAVPKPSPVTGDLFAATLRSPALLNDLDALRNGTSTHGDYARYFKELGLNLVRAFARQRLVGGYIALRYPLRRDRYEPYLLTEAGSVFLLQAPDQAARDALTNAARLGLPPHFPHRDVTWQTCPFMRENGFGALRFNAVDHTRWAAGQEAVA